MMSNSEVNVLIAVPFPEELVERLRAVSPRLNITVAPASDGEQLPDSTLQEAEVLYTARALPDP
ncbi:MAG: hypothetical protein ACLFWD_10340, partial [Anaerolineales bacterium]